MNFTVTWREILFSVIIIAVFFGIGVWISGPISGSAKEKALEVTSAIKVEDAEKFGYIKRTNAGKFLAEGELIANDTIRIPDIPGIYSRIEKVKEEYRSHVETYVTTDGKGHTTTHTRVVHSWDVVGRTEYVSETYTFLGQRFDGKEIDYHPHVEKDTVIYDRKLFGNDVRFVYYVAPVTVNGMMRGVADNKGYSETKFLRDATIKHTVERAEKKARNIPIAFWVCWWIMTLTSVFLFVYCENDWLEDKKKKIL